MRKFLRACVNSLHGYDEIIIYANDGIGYGAAVNGGLDLVSGDHIIVINNDTILIEGSLKDLIVNDAITVPRIYPEPKDNEPRAIFCMPRYMYEEIMERYGFFYDERFEVGYWEDDDLIARLNEMGIERRYVDSVVFGHHNGGGTTMKQMGEQKYYDENKARYDEKWSNS